MRLQWLICLLDLGISVLTKQYVRLYTKRRIKSQPLSVCRCLKEKIKDKDQLEFISNHQWLFSLLISFIFSFKTIYRTDEDCLHLLSTNDKQTVGKEKLKSFFKVVTAESTRNWTLVALATASPFGIVLKH